MQDPKRKNDESVQTGLEIADQHPTNKERDNLIHEKAKEFPDPLEEQDIDDLLLDKGGGEG